MPTTVPGSEWHAWQESWDRQQEWYLPDREERFTRMFDAVEALVGPEPVVLDLACGTGSLTGRALRRFPGARCVGVDLDPALLTIARGHFAGEPRAALVTADLRDPRWTEALPHRAFDAVVTSTALHWLRTEPLRRLYAELAGLVGEGGVLVNHDHMPDEATPRINAALAAPAGEPRRPAPGQLDWDGWWRAAAADDRLAEAVARRREIFGRHSDGEPRSAGWHAEALRAAGFAEARAIWSSGTDATVLAVR